MSTWILNWIKIQNFQKRTKNTFKKILDLHQKLITGSLAPDLNVAGNDFTSVTACVTAGWSDD